MDIGMLPGGIRRGHEPVAPRGALAVLGVCLAGLLALALALPAPSWAAASDGNMVLTPGGDPIEVAPGVYLATSADLRREPGAEAIRAAARLAAGSTSPALARQATPPARIVGGTKTSISRWPWQVSINYPSIAPDDPLKSHVCGGTLVAPRVVVSAAHCFTLGGSIFRQADEYEIISGRTRLSSGAGRVHELDSYYWFVDQQGDPLWNRETIEWDVVFAVLDSAAGQDAIKIAGESEAAVWAPGRRAFVTGWGSNEVGTDDEISGRPSDVLRQGRIRMISDSACEAVYGPVLFPDLMVCAGKRAGGVDACAGDSGGPLVVPIQGGHRLIGDTSFADGCGLPDTPGVYGRLAADPIRSALQGGIALVTGDDVVGEDAAPSNGFTFGPKVQRNKRGTARLAVRVPGRGRIELHETKQLHGAVAWARQSGSKRIAVRPRGATRRKLARLGHDGVARARVRARVVYSPMGGNRRVEQTRITLSARR